MPDAPRSDEREDPPSGTVTFLFTDIESSTDLVRALGEGYGGASVLYVAQLVNEPEPGQILVSHSTEALLEGERLDPWRLRDLGERQVKGFDAPHRVFELVG